MIFSVLSILVALYALFNYKKALMLFTIYQIFWYSTQIIGIGGFNLNANAAIPLWFAFLYLIKKKRVKKCWVQFPYRIPFLLTISSFVFSSFTASTGFSTEFMRALMRIFSVYIFIWILWNCIETKKDFKYLLRGSALVLTVAAVYGIYEYFSHNNPLLDYKVALSLDSISLYDMIGLRGYRLTSVFEHPIGAGMTFGLYAIFVLILWINKKEQLTNRTMYILTSLLCIPCVILCKMRTAIVFTLICALSLIDFGKITRSKLKKFLLLFVVFAPVLYVVGKSNLSLITNLFTSETSSAVGGSSLAMRLSQFEAIKLVISASPIFGLGETFRSVVYSSAALGYEGVIFEQLSMHGIYGIVVTFVLVLYSVVLIPRKYKSKELFFISSAYWVASLVSSIPAFRTLLLYLVYFYFIKTSDVYREMVETSNGESNSFLS